MGKRYGPASRIFSFGVGEFRSWELGGYSVTLTFFAGNYFDYFGGKGWDPEIHVDYIDTLIEKKDIEKDIRNKFRDL